MAKKLGIELLEVYISSDHVLTGSVRRAHEAVKQAARQERSARTKTASRERWRFFYFFEFEVGNRLEAGNAANVA